jgi:signal transduction histidine kinase
MDESRNPKLIFEEKKAVTLLLWLFYFFYFTYELAWNIILPSIQKSGENQIQLGGLGFWQYILILSLLPIGTRYIKKENPYTVKYLLLIGYLIIDITNNMLIYYGTSIPFSSGNIVDLLFIFFSPVFVNKQYFWAATLGIVGKYLLFAIVLKDTFLYLPILITVILSAIAFILLIRFRSYINSLTFAYEELRQKEKLAVIGQMATAIGHEIRNPLSSLKGFTQLQYEANTNSNEFYPIMIQEIDRINSIVDDLMYLGKPREIVFEKAKINEIINYTLSITKQQAEIQGIRMETMIDEQIPAIDCDEKQLKQVFINLIKNAIEAMPDGGTLKIKSESSNEKNICITVEDEGYGIMEADLQNLGVPFYTTKKDGTGLGLMVTNQIIKDHNGSLKIESKRGLGTKVIVTLPIFQMK